MVIEYVKGNLNELILLHLHRRVKKININNKISINSFPSCTRNVEKPAGLLHVKKMNTNSVPFAILNFRDFRRSEVLKSNKVFSNTRRIPESVT